MSHAKRRQIHHGLTLVEVMLALMILGLGILTGVELMARVVAAQAPKSTWESLEPRIIAARQRLAELPYDQVAAQVALGSLTFDDLSAKFVSGSQPSPYPQQALALSLQLTDASGSVVMSIPTLKIKDTQ